MSSVRGDAVIATTLTPDPITSPQPAQSVVQS